MRIKIKTTLSADLDKQMRIFPGSLFSKQTQEIHLKLLTPPAGKHSQLSMAARIFGKDEIGTC